jgi:hypothetical protein
MDMGLCGKVADQQRLSGNFQKFIAPVAMDMRLRGNRTNQEGLPGSFQKFIAPVAVDMGLCGKIADQQSLHGGFRNFIAPVTVDMGLFREITDTAVFPAAFVMAVLNNSAGGVAGLGQGRLPEDPENIQHNQEGEQRQRGGDPFFPLSAAFQPFQAFVQSIPHDAPSFPYRKYFASVLEYQSEPVKGPDP